MNKCYGSRTLSGLVLILGLTLSAEVRSQEFNAGVFAGVVASQIDGDDLSGYNKLGLNLGVLVNREISQDFFWQMELKYVNRGAYTGSKDGNFEKYAYHYLEIPLSLHYVFAEKIQTEIGLSPDVLLQYAAYDAFGQLDPSLNPDNHRFGLGGLVGINYWFTPAMSVGLRWTYSLVSFRDKKEYYVPHWWLKGWHHNVLSLSLTYKIFHP